jgi:hypothetical protein
MQHRVRTVLMLGAVTVASGCGGGQSTTSPAVPAAAQSGATSGSVKVQITVKVPLRTARAASPSARRSPRYVSASTLGLAVRTGSAVGVNSAPWQLFNLSPSAASPNAVCTTDAASAVRTCLVSVTAPVSQGADDVFQVLATDTAPASTDTQPQGNILAEGYTAVTVTAGAVNAASVALSGVIGSLAVAKAAYSVWAAPGRSANVVVGVIANDSDGGQIFGQSASYASPIAFSDGLTASPFTYPNANPPATNGLVPPTTPGPVQATIGYLAPATTVAPAATVTVTAGTFYLADTAPVPSATFALDPMVVSVGTAPSGSLNLTAGSQTLVTVNESAATSFTVSDNATTAVTLLNATGTAPLLPGSSIAATNGTASFIISAVRATSPTAAAVITITDPNGTVARLPLVIT